MTLVDLAELTAENVSSIAQDVWQTVLALALRPHPLGEQVAPRPRPTVTACLQVTGDWHGWVSLQMGADLATTAAEAMFAAEPGSLSPSDVADAVGELTNMIGGQVKALLPSASRLSLPSVTGGSSYAVRIPGAVLLTRVALLCGTGPVLVSVWKAGP